MNVMWLHREHTYRSHAALIRVYDEAGNVIETHEHKVDFKEPSYLNTYSQMSNPAQRLHALLKRAKRKELAANKMLVGWRNVLGLPAPENMDDLIVMSKVGNVFTLPSIITTYIEQFPDLPAELFLGWRDDLFRGLPCYQLQCNVRRF